MNLTQLPVTCSSCVFRPERWSNQRRGEAT